MGCDCSECKRFSRLHRLAIFGMGAALACLIMLLVKLILR